MIFARLGGLGEYSEATIIASYQKLNLIGMRPIFFKYYKYYHDILDLSTQEGLKENSLLTGYIVRFEKDSQKSNDEYFIRNSDVAINENTFESESIEDFKAFPVEINDQSTLALDNIVNRRERKKGLFIICTPWSLPAVTLDMVLGHYEN